MEKASKPGVDNNRPARLRIASRMSGFALLDLLSVPQKFVQLYKLSSQVNKFPWHRVSHARKRSGDGNQSADRSADRRRMSGYDAGPIGGLDDS
jgi:hypothetical protein